MEIRIRVYSVALFALLMFADLYSATLLNRLRFSSRDLLHDHDASYGPHSRKRFIPFPLLRLPN